MKTFHNHFKARNCSLYFDAVTLARLVAVAEASKEFFSTQQCRFNSGYPLPLAWLS